MGHFRCDLFEDPIEYEETPLRDRKQELPYIVQQGWDKKAELLKDVISLANTARMLGKPAYLLFGITNDCSIRGVEHDLLKYSPTGTSENINLRETVRQEFAKAIRRYIDPLVSCNLEFGECMSHLLAYLVIEPLTPSRPFSVKEDFKNGSTIVLAKHRCWIRFGESKHEVDRQEISPDDDRYRYAYSTVPYLLPSHWNNYFSRLQADPSIAKDATLPYHIDQYVTSTLSLDERLQQFLNSPTERLLVIEGEATSGKSVFLNRLCNWLAAEGLAATQEIINREEFLPPPGWIPILFSLRNRRQYVQDVERLAKSLLDRVNTLASFWGSRPSQPERLFEEKQLRWLICFDGLDEIETSASQNAFLGSLYGLMERYPNVRVLMTTRPYPSPTVDWEKRPGASIAHIIPLHEQQIREYIRRQVATSEELEQIMLFLSESPELLALCSYPGYLVATTQELVPHSTAQPQDAASRVEDISVVVPDQTEGLVVNEVLLNSPSLDELIYQEPIEEIEEKRDKDKGDAGTEQSRQPRVGVVLQRVYDYLWEREAERWKWPKYESSAMWDSASKLAIETDGKTRRFPHDILEKHLQSPKRRAKQSLLTLGILHQPEATLWAFQNHLVKIFFAAWWIRNRLIGNGQRSARKKLDNCDDGFVQGVHTMLVQLYDGDLAELFPELPNHNQRTT